MSEKKRGLPEGMLKAAVDAMRNPAYNGSSIERWATIGIEAAMRWLAKDSKRFAYEQILEEFGGACDTPLPAMRGIMKIHHMECAEMQTPVELAQKILSILDREVPRDAISALKIAMILLPVSPTDTTKEKK